MSKKSSFWSDFLPLWMGLLFIGLYLLVMCGLLAFTKSNKYVSEKEAVKYEQECIRLGGVPSRHYGDYNEEIGKIRWVSCQ